MYNSNRTIYSTDLQLATLKGEQYTPYLNTTLNEKFTILTSEQLAANEYPRLNYVAIGTGGVPVFDGVYDSLKANNHTAIDGALYEHIPFIIRPVATDLLPSEQANYRFRKLISVENVDYVAYYLKVLDNTDTRTEIMELTTTTDTPILTSFNNNNSAILNPVPPTADVLVDATPTRYVVKVANVVFTLNTLELEEIKNAIDIIHGANSGYMLTELALCSGVERELNGVAESAITQVMYFVPLNYDVQTLLTDGDNVTKNIEIGGMAPLVIQ